MNRPEVLNALSKRMFKELRDGLRNASKDPNVHWVVIKGSGRAFSAGLDIKEVSGFASYSEARGFVYGLVKPYWEQHFNCEKPILAAVDGPAYGAGAEIALASDIVVASTRSNFAFSGGRVGALCCISAGLGPFIMSGRKLVEMNLTGEAISAQEAQSFGLVNYVVDPLGLEDRVREVIEETRRVSSISNASFKRIRRNLMQRSVLNSAYRELLRSITSPDFKKGAIGFANKTTPEFYQ